MDLRVAFRIPTISKPFNPPKSVTTHTTLFTLFLFVLVAANLAILSAVFTLRGKMFLLPQLTTIPLESRILNIGAPTRDV